MKKYVPTILAVIGVSLSPAFAGGESYDYCMAFAESNDLDPAPCTCIAGNVGDDADLLAEQAALETLDDVDAASAELRDAINSCVSS